MMERSGLVRFCVRTTWLVAVCCLPMAGGCASTEYVKLRSVPKNPLADQLSLTSWSGPQASERTTQLLRKYDLVKGLDGDMRQLLLKLQQHHDSEPNTELLYAIAEVSYLGGKKMESKDKKVALDLYGASVTHAYLYLFDERYAGMRNPYDPHFRGACDLYNGALEGSLRLIKKDGTLTPGQTLTIESASYTCDVTVVARNSRWQPQDFDKFEFVSDFEVQGLTNHYQSYGLGVPLIAVRRKRGDEAPQESFYPPDLSFPVTAFLRVLPDGPATQAGPPRHRALLELFDPLTSTDIVVGERRVPLQSDLSTPLAFVLNDPRLNELATDGLLKPEKTAQNTGLYMLQPYEPGKIPVLMVHGLWSSPLTWMEMFNDLRAMPEIRDRYQFWFYLYPTGQPFWTSATRMREDLARVRDGLDPQHREPALDQMVLVGHSMGGLVSKLQTIESGNDFWNIVSDHPFEQLNADEENKANLEKLFFFHPNPSVRRVITIGTPHRGSKFANDTVRYLATKLIALPQMTVMRQNELYKNNPGVFRDESFYQVKTSLDSLAATSPILPVMLSAEAPAWVKYHNIVGVLPDKGWLGSVAGGTDGVVSYDSAHLDNVVSEIQVNADHLTVHRHPLSVLEVRRILLEHLQEINQPTFGRGMIQPVSGQSAVFPQGTATSAGFSRWNGMPGNGQPLMPGQPHVTIHRADPAASNAYPRTGPHLGANSAPAEAWASDEPNDASPPGQYPPGQPPSPQYPLPQYPLPVGPSQLHGGR